MSARHGADAPTLAERAGIGHGDDASTEAGAGEARAVNAWHRAEPGDERVEGRRGDVEVLGEAAMALDEERAQHGV